MKKAFHRSTTTIISFRSTLPAWRSCSRGLREVLWIELLAFLAELPRKLAAHRDRSEHAVEQRHRDNGRSSGSASTSAAKNPGSLGRPSTPKSVRCPATRMRWIDPPRPAELSTGLLANRQPGRGLSPILRHQGSGRPARRAIEVFHDTPRLMPISWVRGAGSRDCESTIPTDCAIPTSISIASGKPVPSLDRRREDPRTGREESPPRGRSPEPPATISQTLSARTLCRSGREQDTLTRRLRVLPEKRRTFHPWCSKANAGAGRSSR